MLDVLNSESPAETSTRPEPVAPWPHTAFLLVVLVLWAFYGLLHSHLLAAVMPRGISYVTHIVLECLLVGTTIAGLYHRRRFISKVIGIGTVTRHGILLDVAQGFLIYLAGSATMIAIWMVLKPLHLTYQREAVQAMAPHTPVELGLFALLSLAAGTCEEFVFRGYLLRQFQRWWGSTLVAVIVSSVLFGCLHLYEGVGAVVGICGLGTVYAIVAVRRGNLRSVMVAHFLQDALTGLILYLRH
jgi:membrane protease YdiL (CAAX protease family)